MGSSWSVGRVRRFASDLTETALESTLEIEMSRRLGCDGHAVSAYYLTCPSLYAPMYRWAAWS